MAKRSEPRAPEAPALLAPREGAVVDATSVTFSWKPAARASSYRLEVARDASFEEVVLRKELGDATTVTLTDTFAADEQTYFWRVFSVNEVAESHGEVIESFISGTPSDAAAHPSVPDEAEDMGPAPNLLKSASLEVAGAVTGDEAYVAREAELGVEPEGVFTAQILGLVLAIVAALAVTIVLVFQWVAVTKNATRQAAVSEAVYPELRALRLEAQEALSEYGVVDPETGVYRIPIDRAMALEAEEARQQTERYVTPELELLPRD